MNSISLSPLWDIGADSQNNIALVTNANAVAQNVATICRTFKGEAYYDTTIGIPYLSQVLGKSQQPTLLGSLLEDAALTVPDVKGAKVELTTGLDRVAHGSINLVDSLVTF